MNSRSARLIAFGLSACWLVSSERANAQGSFVDHTALSNPDPSGVFGTNGVPVYSVGGGGPFSVLSVDCNHDGVVDYRVVATGTVELGFQIEGAGENAVWSRPTSGGLDLDSQIVPLACGTAIGSDLPGADE